METTTLTSSTKTTSSGRGKKAPMTKAQLINTIAKRTGASVRDIKAVMEAHQVVGAVGLAKTGSFKIHGLATLKTKAKAAKPERQGWNPFTKSHTTFKAKPASMQVKARADTRVKKHLAPKEKTPTWTATQKKQLADRMNNMVIKRSMTKAQIIDHITHKTALARHKIADVFDSMSELCVRELSTRGSFKVPDVANLCVREKKALPEREGINPFTKQPTTFKARAASKVVKAQVPKTLRTLAPAFTDAKSYAASSCPSKISTQSDAISLPGFKGFASEIAERG